MKLRSNKIKMDNQNIESVVVDIQQGDIQIDQNALNIEQIMQQFTMLLTNQTKLISNQINNENKILKEQIELIDNNLNKKMDALVDNMEKQIIEKLTTKLDNEVIKINEGLKYEIEKNVKQVEKKIIDIDKQYTININTLNTKIDTESDNIRSEMNNNRLEQNIQYICGGIHQVENVIQYSGDRKIHPKVFIKNLKEKLNSLSKGNEFKSIIRNSLKGDAEIWYSIIEDKYETIDEFINLFLKNYWGENQQSKVREYLFNGKYKENVGSTREKYIMQKYNYVRHLEPCMSESEIVIYFARHFPENIRDVILIQGIDTIDRLLQYLRRIDDTRRYKNTEKYEDAQGREDGHAFRTLKANRYQNNGYIDRQSRYKNYDRYNNQENGNIQDKKFKNNGNNYSTNYNYENKRRMGQNTENKEQIRRRENEQRNWNDIETKTTAMVEAIKENTNFLETANQM